MNHRVLMLLDLERKQFHWWNCAWEAGCLRDLLDRLCLLKKRLQGVSAATEISELGMVLLKDRIHNLLLDALAHKGQRDGPGDAGMEWDT